MSESSSFLSSQFLPTFIEAYRAHRCLWHVKCKDYTNKTLKAAAYKDLVELTKEVVPECDVEFIKKKIDLLRGNFRRENKKVKSSMKTASGADSVYKPKLWYFNLLRFLTEKEHVREFTSSLDPTPVTEDDIEGSDTTSEASSVGPIVTPSASAAYRRKKKPKLASETVAYLQKAVSILEKREDDHETFAANVAVKLRKMDPIQVIFAENLINQVLFNGMLGRLQENSTIQHPPPFDGENTVSGSGGSSTPFYQHFLCSTETGSLNENQTGETNLHRK